MSQHCAVSGDDDTRTSTNVPERRRREYESTECECDFRVLCDRSPAGMYIVQDDRIRYANPALARLLVCELENLSGVSPLEFIHPEDRGDVEEQLRRRLNGKAETSRFEARCARSDGTSVHVGVLGSRLQYGGRPALLVNMADVTARRQSESEIVNRLRFEQLLVNLSASFINLTPEQFEQRIDNSLQRLVEFLRIDRGTLVEFGDDERHVLVTHAYAVPGCEPFPVGLLAVDRLPWFIGQFRGGRTVFVRDLPDDLPAEAAKERAYCRAHGIKSNVIIPLKVDDTVLGGITFASLRQRCEWPEEIILRLRMIGEVFASALLRRRTEESLRAALAENKSLRQRLEHENQYLREQVVVKYQHAGIIGRTDAITRVLSQAERVAVTDAPVLLFGETGTGKELLAQSIHELSGRKGRAMVIVNCASLPATLVESELFGREAGAYTGAASAQVGRFAVADGSTLFLDEIGEFPIELQAKLLRVLQDGRFERLGSPKTVTVDVRIIAATNRDLNQAVRDGRFRADLYHRLNVFPIHVPPLRERRDDIPQLVWSFVENFGRRMGKSVKSIPRKTMHQLQRYPWPGNVRELSNVVERAMILTSGDTLHVELPPEMRGNRTQQMTLKEREREQILRVLRDTGWRIRGPGGAAEVLEIKPTTLEARMARLGIERPMKNSNIS